jgi:23S rRNA pseudouridine1911/1915/1917 synthase
MRLDRFLADEERLASRRRVAHALERGQVFVNDVEAGPAMAGHRLAEGDRIRLWVDRPGSAHRRIGRTARDGALHIVYEDDAIVVVDKPPGLLAVPLPSRDGTDSVQDLLTLHLRGQGKRRPLVAHRIDRDTSGLVVFAKRSDALVRLKDQFRRHEPTREYLAVVYGCPSPRSGTWRDTLVWDQRALVQKETHPRDPRGKEARCRYEVLQSFPDTSLIRVSLITGRRNQIRLQARLHGHTLVGERRYTYGPDGLRTVPFARQALHAHRLAFRHPIDGRPLAFEAALPADMTELLSRLGKPVRFAEP